MDILTLIKERDWYFDEQKVFAYIERNILSIRFIADEICLHSEKFRPKSKAQVTATLAYLLHTLIEQFNDQWVPILKERYNTFTDHTIRSVLNRLLQFSYD